MRRLILFLVLLSSVQLYGQEFKFEHLGQNVGLRDPFIYSIEQDNNGYLIVGTGEGVGVFDGESFDMKYKSDGLTEDFISCSFSDSKGNIWFGHKSGGSSIYDGKKFDLVHRGDGIGSVITDIAEDHRGHIWFAAQDFGLFYVNQDGKFEFFNTLFQGEYIYSLHIDDQDNFFVGTSEGLEVYRYYPEEKLLSKTQDVSGLPLDQVVKTVKFDDNKILVATLYSGFYIVEQKDGVFRSQKVEIVNTEEEDLVVRDLNYKDEILWVSTLQTGLLKASFEEGKLLVSERYNSSNGLKSDAVNTMFLDREGVMWVGTLGEGLASRGDNLFTFYFRTDQQEEVSHVYANKDQIWVARKGSLMAYNKSNLKVLYSYGVEQGLPDDIISGVKFAGDSILFVSTQESGLFELKGLSGQFNKIVLSEDGLSESIVSLDIVDDKLWIGTLNGVYRRDINHTGVVRYDISSGLTHNYIASIYISKSKDIYVGAQSAYLSKFEDETFRNIQLTPDYDVVTINMITEDSKGDIWLSTANNGIFHISDSITNLKTENGLATNYCYGISEDINGNIWVTHNGGLSKVDPVNYQIETYKEKYGMDTRFVRAAVSRYDNELWLGTENGVVLCNANADVINQIPPITSIRSLIINDEMISSIHDVDLSYGEYDIKIDLMGLSLKNAKGVTYQYYLEGYDYKWSEMTNNPEIIYQKVRDGEYTFHVRSFNADGITGEETTFKITIAEPYWKKWWFYVSIFILLVAAVTVIIKMRESRHIRYQKELELQLAERTKEVVNQKEEIEEINKDLTDSINYAKRIQKAILPEKTEFDELFPKSFIFYKPKDIVSGDFYWVKQFGDQVLITCADCTGHGVPGGFMSMIGTMLMYESAVLKHILDPGKILEDLDTNLVATLRQTDTLESNKDGMDLSVCVIDMKTNLMKFAGALRPVYIYRYGMRTVLRGDRYSLGGTIIKDKTFTTQEYQLEKGDKVYMFSDGYPDQFGGPYQRKLKLTGFHELLDQVSLMPIEKQYAEIDSFFYTWKGDMMQMDDVILIGFEV